MKRMKTTITILGLAFLSTHPLFGDAVAISNAVEEALSNYALLCTQAVERISHVCTETNVLDVHTVYFVGWIHATNAIPALLEIVALPGANESGKRHIAKRIPGSPINPIAILSGPVPPASPTPAAGALAALPVEFSVLTNLIGQTGVNTNRAEMLAWTALTRFGADFGSVLEQKASIDEHPWSYIQGIRTNEWETVPSIYLNQYQLHFPTDDMAVYTNIFHSLRGLAAQCETENDEVTLEFVKAALETIGHPYDENPILWPH